jgi:predicted RNase H-like HicB family nuclease
MPYEVHARWDEDDQHWYAESRALPGLSADAETYEELLEALRARAADLLREADRPEEAADPPLAVRAFGFPACAC